jgi:hypothetical protein
VRNTEIREKRKADEKKKGTGVRTRKNNRKMEKEIK